MTLVIPVPDDGAAFPLNAQKVWARGSRPFIRARADGSVDARLLRFFEPTAASTSGCTACGTPPARSGRMCACR